MSNAEVPARTEQEWATIIRSDLAHAVEGMVAAGQHLAQARCELGRGRYGDMLRAANLHERTAERLMRIAESPVLTNPDYAARLPTSMRTLSELTRFPSPILEGYLQDGTINVATERADVEKLLKEPKPTHGSGSEFSQPVAEAAQSKPPVEQMEAKMARNAEEEAEALAEKIEAKERCSFCDEAAAKDLKLACNASRTAFICRWCSMRAGHMLTPPMSPEDSKLFDAFMGLLVAGLPPDKHPKRGRPKGSKNKKRVAPARQHGDEPGGDRHYEKARATESGGNGSAP
jgi:hypothetical protein